MRDPDAPRVRKNVSFGHEEQVEFDNEKPSDYVGRAPARMMEEGILEGDTRRSRGYALRTRAFNRRADARYAELNAKGEAFNKSDPYASGDPDDAATYEQAQNSEKDAKAPVAAALGLPAYTRKQRKHIAANANDSDTYRGAISAAHGISDDPFAQFGGDGPGLVMQEDGPVGPQVSRAEQSLLPRSGAYAAMQADRLRARFARANQVDFGGSRYRSPERYEGGFDEKTLRGTDELQTHVNLRGRFQDQVRLQAETQADAKKGMARGEEGAEEGLWTGGGRGGRTPYGFTNASTPERPYFQSLDPTRYKYERDITASRLVHTGNLNVNVGEDGGMGMSGVGYKTVQGPTAAPVDVSNAEDLLMNELDAKDDFSDKQAPQLLERQKQVSDLTSYIQRKTSKQEAKKGWKLFDPSSWFGHWGKNKRRANKIASAQQQLEGLSSQWADQDSAYSQSFSRFDLGNVATPRRGYQAPRAANPGLFTDPLAHGSSRARAGSLEVPKSAGIPEPADDDSDFDVDEFIGQVRNSTVPEGWRRQS